MHKLLLDYSGKDVCKDFSIRDIDRCIEVDDFDFQPLPKTEIVSSGENYHALMENVYEDDVEHLMIASIIASKDFIPEKMVMFHVRKPDGGTLSLNCSIKWFLRALDKSEKVILGIKVIDPPQSYRAFIRDQGLLS